MLLYSKIMCSGISDHLDYVIHIIFVPPYEMLASNYQTS